MELNASQRAAVEHAQGPLLVLAGAGSGKTRVITHRIARLVERGTRPEAILAVSFTNKAAAEMGERMTPLVGRKHASSLWLSTFHSFGLRLLGQEREALGSEAGVVVFDQGDSIGVVREVLRTLRRGGAVRKLDAAAIQARISIWKNQLVAPEAVRESEVEYDAIAREVYPRYEAALRAMCAFDFDDLVVAVVRLLERREDVRDKWRKRFRHVLIDEFQDTNVAQLALVKLLANELGNVCVVGDDDQAIYGWRGADVRNILEFEQHFPGARVVKLEDNYRSTAAILGVANAAIARSPARRHEKTLRAYRKGGDRVRLAAVDDAEQEAKLVAAEIADLDKARSVRLADIAILYRSNLQTRLIEEELRARQLPHRIFGGTQFFDRKEVKDAAAYLRVVVNPRDEISLRRILNYPARGIGETTVERIERHARAKRVPFVEALASIETISDVPDAARRGADSVLSAIARARAQFRAEGASLARTARSLFETVGLRRELDEAAEGGKDGERRWDNVEHLVSSIERYEGSERAARGGGASLIDFLSRITLTRDEDEEDPRNQITLSTLHAAKGLEFRVVFLIGCVEGRLPHARTTDPKITEAAPSDVEEERRLFYVGVTRARDILYLVRPRRAALRGRVTPLAPSRFLEALPEDHTEEYVRKDIAPIEVDDLAAMTRDLLARLGTRTAT